MSGADENAVQTLNYLAAQIEEELLRRGIEPRLSLRYGIASTVIEYLPMLGWVNCGEAPEGHIWQITRESGNPFEDDDAELTVTAVPNL